MTTRSKNRGNVDHVDSDRRKTRSAKVHSKQSVKIEICGLLFLALSERERAIVSCCSQEESDKVDYPQFLDAHHLPNNNK